MAFLLQYRNFTNRKMQILCEDSTLSLEATESYQEARKTVQEFIHAEEPEEIIFTRNTTESLNLVAYSYGLNFLKEGDEIAVTIMEHHSNLLPWQMVSRMTGAKLHYLECTSEGELTDESSKRALMREHVLWLLRRYRMCSAA